MTETVTEIKPFPGLRSFEAHEDHLFFGREKQIDALLERLRRTRFLAVVGTSGSGKSSLVGAGLVPSLYSGHYMVQAGSSWRVALFRPGEDPIGKLAAALGDPEVLGEALGALAAALGDPEDLGDASEMAGLTRAMIETTLRSSSRGLGDSVRQAGLPAHDNILVVVDQFEELFRYKHSRASETARDEAVAFVKLLLDAARQEVPVYVVLTMRSDFIGDCMEFHGLPEAINQGQYLVPRMDREELRAAITGPVAVGGGAITPRLVSRLLNDVGDDPDQLPVLQHALMRLWDHGKAHATEGQPLDLPHYEAIGTMSRALSQHAEEAYGELAADHRKEIAEKLFKALTDTSSDPRGVRRPASLRDLCAITGAGEAEVIEVIDRFRQPGRSFLMPPAGTPIYADTIIDISHESLMRVWERLIGWAEEERLSAVHYGRLAQAATWREEGTAGLWRDPQLQLALDWKKKNGPTAVWAQRYDPAFERAMDFLDESETLRARELRAAEKRRRLRLIAGGMAVLAVLAAFWGIGVSGNLSEASIET